MTDTRHSWVEKHRPDSWTSIQGNNKAIRRIKRWAENWAPGDSPVLLTGPPGVGKTTIAYVAAQEMDLALNQINTSSARRTEDVAEIAEEARTPGQLLLLDEVDSWPANVDLDPLRAVLRDPPVPVICTANRDWEVPYAIESPAEQYEISLQKRSRKARLRDIVEAEGLDLDEEALDRLADRPGLRSAIQDLQVAAQMDRPVGEGGRSDQAGVFDALDSVIQQGRWEDTEKTPPDLLRWFDRNLPKEYRGLELIAAYEALSRADKHLARSGGTDYRGWRWAGRLQECLPRLRLSEPYTGFISWDTPEWVETEPTPGDDPEAALHEELPVSASYAAFCRQELGLLRGLPTEEKVALARDEALSAAAVEALGLDPDRLEEALEPEAPESGEDLGPETQSALEGW